MKEYLYLFAVGAGLTLLLFLLFESLGFLLTRIFDKNNDENGKSNNYVIHFFIGIPVLTMIYFTIGTLNILYKELVISIALIFPLLTFFAYKRWGEFSFDGVLSSIKKNKFIIIGQLIFISLSFIFFFRPALEFDFLWYHITIPKLFLQNHSINGLGGHLRYSLQPVTTYFLTLIPLSLPISLPVVD